MSVNSSSLFDLSGKVAVITGATKGVGLGIARQMAAHGARLVVSSRDRQACDGLAQELENLHGKGVAKGFACDIDSLEQIEQLAQAARTAFDGVDILVCNAAALAFIGPSSSTPVDTFDRLLSTNIHHNFRLAESLRADLARRGGGSIVFIGSLAGHSASPGLLAYAVSKAGVAHLARCMADEMAGDGIRVNCIAPGLIRSFSSQPIWRNSARLKESEAGIPLGRIGEPDDVAGAVVFLVSRAGSYVTGETLLVDGGRTRLSPPRRAPDMPIHSR